MLPGARNSLLKGIQGFAVSADANPLTPETASGPSAAAIRRQLALVLENPEFRATRLRRAFLEYVVEEALGGRADRLKGVSIAISVYGRDSSFDQREDPVVRLEARRLRRDLDSYYAGPGGADPIRISIPKGGYAPAFDHVAPPGGTKDGKADVTHRDRRLKYLWGLAGLVALMAVIWIGFAQIGPGLVAPKRNTIASLPKGPVIAILPFRAVGDRPQLLADGLTQQLASELVRFRDLWVLPLGAVTRFGAGLADPKSLSDEFGADYALEGEVIQVTNTLKITARLINLETTRYAWVTSLATGPEPRDIYATQNEIVSEIVGNLAGKYGLLAEPAMTGAQRRPPDNRDAYDCVLRYYDYQIKLNLNQHDEVLACMERAVSLDPDYAEAWAILSNLYLQKARFGLGGDTASAIASAGRAARRSVDLDPRSAYGQLMLSNLLHTTGNITEFRQAGELALELNPNDVTVLAHYGLRLAVMGEWEAGIALIDRAIKLNPLHPRWFYLPKAFHRYLDGAYEEALDITGKIDMPGFFWDPLIRAAIYGQMGKRIEASDALRELLALKPGIASEAVTFMQVWQFEDAFRASLLDGLKRAGLEIDS